MPVERPAKHNRHIIVMKDRLKATGLKVKAEHVDLVLKKCHYDMDLAMTALLMRPRPDWVEEIAGPHPH